MKRMISQVIKRCEYGFNNFTYDHGNEYDTTVLYYHFEMDIGKYCTLFKTELNTESTLR